MSTVVNNKKKDLAQRIGEIASRFMEYVDREFPYEASYFGDKIRQNIVELLDVEKPRVMVYGIYNSGKSTLINSLCREEVAEMADRPMTDRISEYDRGDYLLVDSPGVDAPIEHELVTEEYLNKCHVILFVISSKGIFEDRANYIKLAKLIEKDIPFIIVLNERGMAVDRKWTPDEKKRAKFEHEQELKVIQYKIIKNLVKESNNSKIADKYEVVVLNAKKALTGIQKEKPQLFDASGVPFLEKRITQLINNDSSVKALFQQPITNMKECFNEIEKLITQMMNGNEADDFALRIHILESKKDNILQDLKILCQQAVKSRVEELTNAYVNGDSDIFETIANTVFMDVDERYSAKVNELLVYVDHNFRGMNLYIDTMSNLMFDSVVRGGEKLSSKTETEEYKPQELAPEKKGFFDFLKSRKKREEEKRERMLAEARWKNEYAQYKVQEQMRKKQEARQIATSDLDELNRMLLNVVTRGLHEKYDDLISQIQQIDCLNKQLLEEGRCKMDTLRIMRNDLMEIENEII